MTYMFFYAEAIYNNSIIPDLACQLLNKCRFLIMKYLMLKIKKKISLDVYLCAALAARGCESLELCN